MSKPAKVLKLGYTGVYKFYIPAELEVFISFAPIKNRPERNMISSFDGFIKIEARFIKNRAEIPNDDGDIEIYW